MEENLVIRNYNSWSDGWKGEMTCLRVEYSKKAGRNDTTMSFRPSRLTSCVERCVGVMWSLFHVLQLLPIRFTQQKLASY